MEMKKQQGFTLIELLAVIVILAIIALIATPMILGMINKAKKGAIEASALGYIKAFENSLIFNENLMEDNVLNIKEVTNVSYHGNGPTKGYLQIKNNSVATAFFCIDQYVVKYQNSIAKVEHKKCDEINEDGILKDGFVLNINDASRQKLKDLIIIGNEENGIKVGQNGKIELLVTGKNLVHLFDLPLRKKYDLEYQVKNQEINLNGHLGSNGIFLYDTKNQGESTFSLSGLVENASYTFSVLLDGLVGINPDYINSTDSVIYEQAASGRMGLCYVVKVKPDFGTCFIKSNFQKTYINNSSSEYSNYLFLQPYSSYHDVKAKVQIEYGNKKTPYEPYQEKRYTILLMDENKNLINGLGKQDKIYQEKGDWVLKQTDQKIKLSKQTQEILNSIELNDGVSNVFIEDGVKAKLQFKYYDL